jgi:hypothetical protein
MAFMDWIEIWSKSIDMASTQVIYEILHIVPHLYIFICNYRVLSSTTLEILIFAVVLYADLGVPIWKLTLMLTP